MRAAKNIAVNIMNLQRGRRLLPAALPRRLGPVRPLAPLRCRRPLPPVGLRLNRNGPGSCRSPRRPLPAPRRPEPCCGAGRTRRTALRRSPRPAGRGVPRRGRCGALLPSWVRERRQRGRALLWGTEALHAGHGPGPFPQAAWPLTFYNAAVAALVWEVAAMCVPRASTPGVCGGREATNGRPRAEEKQGAGEGGTSQFPSKWGARCAFS